MKKVLPTLILILISLTIKIPSQANCYENNKEPLLISITFTADVWGAEEEVYRILNVLDKYQVKATFFFLGKYAELKPHVLRKVLMYGHEIGARTYDHSRRLIDMEKSEQLMDINKTIKLIHDATGIKPIGFASPGYFINQETLEVLKELGFLYDRSARGALHDSNDEVVWRWQNDTIKGIKYEGIFSNQRPFQPIKGLFEIPVTYALNYGYFNKSLELDPLWWEKINGTDVILSDGTWLEELKWNQTQSLKVLNYGLAQQSNFKMPLVISFSTHIIGKAEWIQVLETFLKVSKSYNPTFLTLTELMDWWFFNKAIRLKKSTQPIIASIEEKIHVKITVEVLKGNFSSITLLEKIFGLNKVETFNGNIEKERDSIIISWVKKNLSNEENFVYSIILEPSSILSFQTSYDESLHTISRGYTLETILITDELNHSIGPILIDGKIYLSLIIFWPLMFIVSILVFILLIFLWRKMKIGLIVLFTLIVTFAIIFFTPEKSSLFNSMIIALSLASIFYAMAIFFLRKRKS